MVTGGAGYIGGHVVRALVHAGMGAVAFDNLSTGLPSFVGPGAPLVQGDILDRQAVADALTAYQCAGVIHCAGFKYAGRSVLEPLHTYRQNTTGTIELLQAMADAGVNRLVFSSSASVYGTPSTPLVTEDSACQPESPYGSSKLVSEWIIRDQVLATAGTRDALSATSLRYFNVVGAGADDIYDVSPHNLFPRVFGALLRGERPFINGDDFPTPDGTCVRDYVHVEDLARTHVAAARALDAGKKLHPVYNLGSGDGTSVREIMDAMKTVTGIDLDPQIGPRRPGDPARIVASGALAAQDLGWEPTYSVEQMVASAWAATPGAGASGLGARANPR